LIFQMMASSSGRSGGCLVWSGSDGSLTDNRRPKPSTWPGPNQCYRHEDARNAASNDSTYARSAAGAKPAVGRTGRGPFVPYTHHRPRSLHPI
jgi:hypothetical protein